MSALNSIFSRTADAVFAIDSRRKIVYRNEVFADIFRCPTPASSHRACYEVVCGRTLDGKELCNPDCPIGQSVLEGRPVENFDLAIPRDRSEPLQLNVGAMSIAKGFGKAAAVFILRPIHARLAEDERQTRNTPCVIHKLTHRERQILELLAKGMNTRVLADTLHIDYVTARNHIQHIYQKLGVHSRAEALGYVFRNGLPR